MKSSVPQQKLGQSPPSEPQVGPTLKCFIKLVAHSLACPITGTQAWEPPSVFPLPVYPVQCSGSLGSARLALETQRTKVTGVGSQWPAVQASNQTEVPGGNHPGTASLCPVASSQSPQYQTRRVHFPAFLFLGPRDRRSQGQWRLPGSSGLIR